MIPCRSILRRHAHFAPVAAGVLLSLLLLPAATPAQQNAPPPNPALEALRSSNPTTAAELVRAMQVAINFDRYDEGEFYLERLLALDLEVEDLVALQVEYGTAPFIRMAQDEQLSEEGRIFATAVMETAHAYATNPTRLAAMVEELTSEDDATRRAALAGLVLADDAAVGPLLAAVGNPRQYPQTEQYQAALVHIGQPAVAPLIAALSTTDEATQANVIEVLARLKNRAALPYLVRPLLDSTASEDVRTAAADAFVRIVGEVPSARAAERYLANRARNYYENQERFRTDVNGLAQVWRWEQGRAVPVMVPPWIATRLFAADLTRDLATLWPANIEYRRLYLSSLLEAEKSRVGLAMPLPTGPQTIHDESAAAGNAALVDMLAEALENNRPIAAMAACEVLGNSGDLSLLDSVGGEKSTLVRALSYPNRRVQFFAAQAVLKLEPTEAYAGSDDLTQTLGYLGRSLGERRVLVADARTQQLHRMAGLLNTLGYATESLGTGRALLREAMASPDVELIILGDSLDSSNVAEVLQMLRKDPRTAAIPVGLIASEDNLSGMERLAENFPPAVAFHMPVEETALVYHTSRLFMAAGEHYVPTDERIAMARASLTWLSQLAAQAEKYSFYNFLVQESQALVALASPETSVQAAELLGLLATPAAQKALVDKASQNTQPLAVRQAAAAAFAVAVEQRGLLLTTDQILLQYDRYNQSATLDRDTQAVLSAVLDAIEAPTATDAAE